MRTTRKKVTIFGNFGTQNPGNEGTLLTILARLRSVYPGSEVLCVCLHPEAITERDGIDRFRLPLESAGSGIAVLGLGIPMALSGLSRELRQYPRVFKALKEPTC